MWFFESNIHYCSPPPLPFLSFCYPFIIFPGSMTNVFFSSFLYELFMLLVQMKDKDLISVCSKTWKWFSMSSSFSINYWGWGQHGRVMPRGKLNSFPSHVTILMKSTLPLPQTVIRCKMGVSIGINVPSVNITWKQQSKVYPIQPVSEILSWKEEWVGFNKIYKPQSSSTKIIPPQGVGGEVKYKIALKGMCWNRIPFKILNGLGP